MHFIPCTIYLGHSLPSPLGPMNRTSFFAVSALTKNTRILGSLSLAPGQVYFRPHPPPPTPTTQTQLPSVHSPLPLTSFFAPLEWNKLESSIFGRTSEHCNSPKQLRRISFGRHRRGMMFADRDHTKSLIVGPSLLFCLAETRTRLFEWPTLPV